MTLALVVTAFTLGLVLHPAFAAVIRTVSRLRSQAKLTAAIARCERNGYTVSTQLRDANQSFRPSGPRDLSAWDSDWAGDVK